MVNYTCFRCGYDTHIKTILVRHLARKNTCGLKLYDIDLVKFKQYIENGNKCDEYLQSINLGKSSIKVEEMTKSVKDMSNFVKETPQLMCEYCEKILNNRQSKWYHLKICKKKKEEEQVKESMTELVKLLNEQLKEKNKELEKRDKQLEKRDKQIDELIKKAGINNSTITNNLQNNIKLLAYENTDISKLTDNDILNCMNHSNMCVPHLIKMIHLNPEKPENHNIYISNLKNGYIMIYDGTKWDTKNREELIIDMIDDKQGLIEERIEIWIEKGKKYPSIMKKFERYLEKKDNNIIINKITTGILCPALEEEIKLMLFNNKNLIKERLN